MADTTAQRRRAPERRRRDILDAASRLFWERGFDATTVQHIAAAAGVAAGTVYLYFPSKEHVLLAMHDDFHSAMQQHMADLASGILDDVENYGFGVGIDALVDAVVDFVLERQEETSVICRYLPRVHDDTLHDVDDMASMVGAAIRVAMDAGRIHVSDPEMAGRIFTAALREPLIHAVVEGRIDDLPRLAAQAKELFRKALLPTTA